MDLKNTFDYCAFYCEENIWKLCQRLLNKPEFQGRLAYAVFISNPQQSCAIWHQKQAESEEQPVVFDYHVILLVENENEQGWQVWDLDTTLGIPVDAETYFRESFSIGFKVPQEFRPLFRLVTAQDYLQHLSTDRSHMRDDQGQWLKPPPDWEAPFNSETGMNLFEYVEMRDGLRNEGLTKNGEKEKLLDLDSMWKHFVNIHAL